MENLNKNNIQHFNSPVIWNICMYSTASVLIWYSTTIISHQQSMFEVEHAEYLFWVARVALYHRLNSTQPISTHLSQPISSQCGTYTVFLRLWLHKSIVLCVCDITSNISTYVRTYYVYIYAMTRICKYFPFQPFRIWKLIFILNENVQNRKYLYDMWFQIYVE